MNIRNKSNDVPVTTRDARNANLFFFSSLRRFHNSFFSFCQKNIFANWIASQSAHRKSACWADKWRAIVSLNNAIFMVTSSLFCPRFAILHEKLFCRMKRFGWNEVEICVGQKSNHRHQLNVSSEIWMLSGASHQKSLALDALHWCEWKSIGCIPFSSSVSLLLHETLTCLVTIRKIKSANGANKCTLDMLHSSGSLHMKSIDRLTDDIEKIRFD